MGLALRNIMEKVGLREPEMEEYDDEYFEEDAPLGEVHEFPVSTEPEVGERVAPTPAAPPSAAPARAIDRIKTAKPTSYDAAPEVGNYLRDGIPVILNLAYMSQKEGQRMVDFAIGLTYGLRGSFEEVGTRVFLLTPENLKTVDEAPKPL